MERLKKERGARRLAAALLRDVTFLPRDDQKAALIGAAQLMEGLPGVPHREAARLFAKLPADLGEAAHVLKLLATWVEFVETGIVQQDNLNELAVVIDTPSVKTPPREVVPDQTVLKFKRSA
jgi:hypothetical protein